MRNLLLLSVLLLGCAHPAEDPLAEFSQKQEDMWRTPTEWEFDTAEKHLQRWYDDHGLKHLKAIRYDFKTDGNGHWKLNTRLWFDNLNSSAVPQGQFTSD